MSQYIKSIFKFKTHDTNFISGRSVVSSSDVKFSIVFKDGRNWKYNPIGRNQKNEEEAIIFDKKVKSLLSGWQIDFEIITAGEIAIDYVMDNIVNSQLEQQLDLGL